MQFRGPDPMMWRDIAISALVSMMGTTLLAGGAFAHDGPEAHVHDTSSEKTASAPSAKDIGQPMLKADDYSLIVEGGEVLPNWRLDTGTSFGVYGWDGGPFKIGHATVQAIVNYKLIDLGHGFELQAGWVSGVVIESKPVAEIEMDEDQKDKAWFVSGPSAGIRYADVVGGNLFLARLGEEGEYMDVTYWAVGVNLTVNPNKLLKIAVKLIKGVESPDEKKSAPVAWIERGAVKTSPGIYRIM